MRHYPETENLLPRGPASISTGRDELLAIAASWQTQSE